MDGKGGGRGERREGEKGERGEGKGERGKVGVEDIGERWERGEHGIYTPTHMHTLSIMCSWKLQILTFMSKIKFYSLSLWRCTSSNQVKVNNIACCRSTINIIYDCLHNR